MITETANFKVSKKLKKSQDKLSSEHIHNNRKIGKLECDHGSYIKYLRKMAFIYILT